jgi:hypothetical protein
MKPFASFLPVCLALLALAGMKAMAQPASAQGHASSQAVSLQSTPPENPERPVIVELFSSQGCGNCLQANRNIYELAKRSDVIALTYSVGYWDYLGWRDTFAKQEFADRQKRYNRSLGYRGPYTPQVIYSGKAHGPGSHYEAILERLAYRENSPFKVKVKFEDGAVKVSGEPRDYASVVLVHFEPGSRTYTPKGGENRGKEMTFFNLVSRIEYLGGWRGGDARFPAKCDMDCVVLVQDKGPEGPVIGASRKKKA